MSEHCRLCFFILVNVKDNMVKESDKGGKNESRRVHNEQDKGKATRASNFPSSTTSALDTMTLGYSLVKNKRNRCLFVGNHP